MATITKLRLNRKPPDPGPPTDVEGLRARLRASCDGLCGLTDEWSARDAVTLAEFEEVLRVALLSLGQLLLMLFLALRERRVVAALPRRVTRGGRTFRVAPAIERSLSTLFGVVRYRRTYMREVSDGPRRGFFPLDEELGLTADRFSWNVLSAAVKLSTLLSFAQARSVLGGFVPSPPSTEVIEQAVLGLGRRTEEWFRTAPAPEDDGDVLIVMVDSKGAPTARKNELRRRRGKRRKRRQAPSPRHRGRLKRRRHPKPPRRKKGDKSKNAKLATIVVMYTLRRKGKRLLGPINRKVYASFAPKRHAFEVARREADKRGFKEGSGKLVQLMTDGDSNFEVYAKEYFPSAIHSIDVMHVIEKLWAAGECLHREGSDELREWFNTQRERLYAGEVSQIIVELQTRFAAIPKTGPGNKGRRERLSGVLRYLRRRCDKLNYHELVAKDLEIGSGPVEGAVKHVIGRRFDHGGMRWIKERAEALLQLRCIEVNGDWEAFMRHVHQQLRGEAIASGARIRVQAAEPAPLPVPMARRAA